MWYYTKRYVIIELDGVRPEWMLNAFHKAEIPVYDAKFLSGKKLRLRIRAGDFKKLHALSRHLPFRAHIVARLGCPFQLMRLRHRAVLVFGGAALCFLFAFLSARVLVISVTGCEKVPVKAVLRLLSNEGVKPFALRDSIEVIPVADRVRAADDRIAWLGLDLDGVRCRVEVVEAVPMGKTVDSKTPCDVVAQKSGAILTVEALNGLAAVMRGQVVAPGEVLIKGHITEETAEDQVYVHARGEVMAAVHYRSEATAEPMDLTFVDTGKTAVYRRVSVGKLGISESKAAFAQYEVRNTITRAPAGTLLPLSVTEGTYYEQTETMMPLPLEEQIARAASEAETRCYERIPRDAAITNKITTYEEIDGVIKATCLIVTKESIGATKEIIN